jgi:hypothetical protein
MDGNRMSDGGAVYDDVRTFLGNLVSSQTDESEVAEPSAATVTGALTATRETVVDTQAQATALQAASDATAAAGLNHSDLFERTSVTDLGADWLINDSGAGTATLATANGHDAALIAGSGAYRADAFYIPADGVEYGRTVTDYQKVTITTASRSELGSSTTTGAINYIYARANDTGTSFVYAKIIRTYSLPFYYQTNVDIELGCVVSGTETVFTTVTDIAAQGTYSLICGSDGITPRKYEIRGASGQLLLAHTEAGTTSQVGATYRSAGMGFETDTAGGTQLQPSRVAAWALSDYAAAPVSGSGALMSRTATTVMKAVAGSNVWGAYGVGSSSFDLIEAESPDIEPDGSGNFYVSVSGWYEVKIRVLLSASLAVSTRCRVTTHDPTGAAYSRNYLGEYVATSTTRVIESYTVYVPYGIDPSVSATGYRAVIGPQITTAGSGHTTGPRGANEETYMSCVRISP